MMISSLPLLLVVGLVPQVLLMDLVTAQTSSSTTPCAGPRSAGELREALWAGSNVKYDKFTRPNVAHKQQAYRDNPLQYFMNETLRDTVDVRSATAEPELVRAQLHILSLTDLNQKSNEYKVNVWFRQKWNDYRLQYKSELDGGCFDDSSRVGYSMDTLKELWHPDLFIENQVKLDTVVAGAVWIYPNGDVTYVRALQLTLACSMDFNDFPHDVQNCGFRIGTWLEDASDVTLGFYTDMDPITVASFDQHQKNNNAFGGSIEWTIIEAGGIHDDETGDAVYGFTQAESYIQFYIKMKRRMAYYTDFVIWPAIFMVLLSWSSFFIGRAAAPARVALSVISFLANSNFLASQLATLPKLGNDAWLLKFLTISQLFTLYAVLEYVTCNYLRRLEGRIDGGRKRAEEFERSTANLQLEEEAPRGGRGSDGDGDRSGTNEITKQDILNAGFDYKCDILLMNKKGKLILTDEVVENFSRIAYPIAYVVACSVLWFGTY